MKKEIKDAIKYVWVHGKRIAVTANLIAMLNLGNVACATVQPEKSFSVHKEVSDPEHEKEAAYNKKLIDQSNKDRKFDGGASLDFWFKKCCDNKVVMARYKLDKQKIYEDIVAWLSGETNINPVYYTYEEDKILKSYCEKKTGVKGYETIDGGISCPVDSKER
jgi:hypothetical protein